MSGRPESPFSGIEFKLSVSEAKAAAIKLINEMSDTSTPIDIANKISSAWDTLNDSKPDSKTEDDTSLETSKKELEQIVRNKVDVIAAGQPKDIGDFIVFAADAFLRYLRSADFGNEFPEAFNIQQKIISDLAGISGTGDLWKTDQSTQLLALMENIKVGGDWEDDGLRIDSVSKADRSKRMVYQVVKIARLIERFEPKNLEKSIETTFKKDKADLTKTSFINFLNVSARAVSDYPSDPERALTDDKVATLYKTVEALDVIKSRKEYYGPEFAKWKYFIVLLEQVVERILHEHLVIVANRDLIKREFFRPSVRIDETMLAQWVGELGVSVEEVLRSYYQTEGIMMRFMGEFNQEIHECDVVGSKLAAGGIATAGDLSIVDGLLSKVQKSQNRYLELIDLDKKSRLTREVLARQIVDYIEWLEFLKIKVSDSITANTPVEKKKANEKPVNQWNIEECIDYIIRSNRKSTGQASEGVSIYNRYKLLLEQLEQEAPENAKYWKSKVGLHDLLFEGYQKGDFSIDQTKYEGMQVYGIERRLLVEGLMYHPEWGEAVREVMSIFEKLLRPQADEFYGRTKDGVPYYRNSNKDNRTSAAMLTNSNLKDLEDKAKAEFKAWQTNKGIVIPDHVFYTTMAYANAFDVRDYAFLNFLKRGNTRGFGGKDVGWVENPFAVVSYYLQRYATIPDAKVLMLLCIANEDFPDTWEFDALEELREATDETKQLLIKKDEQIKSILPASWIYSSEGFKEERKTKAVRINHIGELLKEYFDQELRVEMLLKAIKECGYEFDPDRPSVFPTIWEFMQPLTKNGVPVKNGLGSLEVDETTGAVNFENLQPIENYLIGRAGWEEVLTIFTSKLERGSVQSAIDKIDKFHRAIGKAKLVVGPHMELLKPLSLIYYVRVFHTLENPADFEELCNEVEEKLAQSGGAEGVPQTIRQNLEKFVSGKNSLGVRIYKPLLEIPPQPKVNAIKKYKMSRRKTKLFFKNVASRYDVMKEDESHIKMGEAPFNWGTETNTKGSDTAKK